MAGPMSPYLALAAALTLGLILGASLHALWQARTRVQPMRPLPAAESITLTDPVEYDALARWEAADLGPFDDADDDPFWGEYPPPPFPHPSESTTLTRHAVADLLRHRESTGGL